MFIRKHVFAWGNWAIYLLSGSFFAFFVEFCRVENIFYAFFICILSFTHRITDKSPEGMTNLPSSACFLFSLRALLSTSWPFLRKGVKNKGKIDTPAGERASSNVLTYFHCVSASLANYLVSKVHLLEGKIWRDVFSGWNHCQGAPCFRALVLGTTRRAFKRHPSSFRDQQAWTHSRSEKRKKELFNKRKISKEKRYFLPSHFL